MKVVELPLLASSLPNSQAPSAIRQTRCLQWPTVAPDICQADPSPPFQSTRHHQSVSSGRLTEHRDNPNYQPNTHSMFRSTVMEEYRDDGEQCRVTLQWRPEPSMSQGWSPPDCELPSRCREALPLKTAAMNSRRPDR